MTGCCCFPFFFKKRPSAHADGGLTQPLRDDPEADEPGALPRPPSLDPWTKRGMQKAARVLEEMLSTERAYVNDLRALSSHFLAPPSGAKLPLGPLGVELASWVASLLRVHQELLKQLEQIGAVGHHTGSERRGADLQHDDPLPPRVLQLLCRHGARTAARGEHSGPPAHRD